MEQDNSSMPPPLPERPLQATFVEEDEEETPVLPPRPIAESRHEPRKARSHVTADLVPDLHGILTKQGLSTELDTSDTAQIRQAVTEAEHKTVPATAPTKTISMPGAFRTGWKAFSISSSVKRADVLDEVLPNFLYGQWYHNAIALFVTAAGSFILAKMNASIGTVILFCFFIGNFSL
ncbi:hypothetical protein G6F57_020390 [Rhizopus arrhizus]|nr:hypothetical protein G6F57_020390 [Rhizopus arrhizus]